MNKAIEAVRETVHESFVGIDVSKATLDICIEPGRKFFQVAYDEQGIARLIQCLKETPSPLIVLEATGGLEVRVATELLGQGFLASVINPAHARNFARADGSPRRTGWIQRCWRPLPALWMNSSRDAAS